ncbi:MAG: GFA family protein [Sphingobium sp.]
MAFKGGCHCGAVTFSVDADLPTQGMSCNCSHCGAKGFLLAFFPASRFTLEQGADALSTYRFNTHRLAHRFCTTCGVQPFAEGQGPDGSDMRAVNLRAVEGLDIGALSTTQYDGASL